jgi:hypothetical protein
MGKKQIMDQRREVKNNIWNMPLTGAERVALARKARGIWKNRKPDPIKELQIIRRKTV